MSSKDEPDVPIPQGPLSGGIFDNPSIKVSNATMNGVEIDPDDLAVAMHSVNAGAIGTNAYVDSYVNNQPCEVVKYNGQDTLKVKGNLIIEDKNGEIVDVGDFIEVMKERMLMLAPNFEAMEEYPALKDAYNQYKMLERLLLDANKVK